MVPSCCKEEVDLKLSIAQEFVIQYFEHAKKKFTKKKEKIIAIMPYSESLNIFLNINDTDNHHLPFIG